MLCVKIPTLRTLELLIRVILKYIRYLFSESISETDSVTPLSRDATLSNLPIGGNRIKKNLMH